MSAGRWHHFFTGDEKTGYTVKYDHGSLSVLYNDNEYRLSEPLCITEDCGMMYAGFHGPILKLTYSDGPKRLYASAWPKDFDHLIDSAKRGREDESDAGNKKQK